MFTKVVAQLILLKHYEFHLHAYTKENINFIIIYREILNFTAISWVNMHSPKVMKDCSCNNYKHIFIGSGIYKWFLQIICFRWCLLFIYSYLGPISSLFLIRTADCPKSKGSISLPNISLGQETKGIFVQVSCNWRNVVYFLFCIISWIITFHCCLIAKGYHNLESPRSFVETNEFVSHTNLFQR